MTDGSGTRPTHLRGTVTMRPRSARSLGAVMMAVSGLGLVTVLVEGPESALRYGGPLALFGLVGWAAFWQPHVVVSDGGITVVNTLRTIEVPWPAVESVDGRYGLRLETTYGRITAWGASAPTGRNRARERHGEAAQAVVERLEQLRGAGYLDDRRLERPSPAVTWHVPVIVAFVALAVASVALPFLA